MADSTTDYNNLDPLGDETAVVDEVDAAVSGARKKPRAVDMVPEEPDAMAPDEEYQLTPAGRRERIGQIVRLVKKYRVWDNLTPVRLRRLLEELGPMFVKMGQILANRSEILPQRFCDELRRLRSDVEPVPYEVVLRCLEEEYGLRLGEMFDAIDPNPLGSASLAQVHRARLVTGEDVAVKVQRPGAQQVMAQDIDIIRSVVRIVSKFVNTDQFVDLHGVVEELPAGDAIGIALYHDGGILRDDKLLGPIKTVEVSLFMEHTRLGGVEILGLAVTHDATAKGNVVTLLVKDGEHHSVVKAVGKLPAPATHGNVGVDHLLRGKTRLGQVRHQRVTARCKAQAVAAADVAAHAAAGEILARTAVLTAHEHGVVELGGLGAQIVDAGTLGAALAAISGVMQLNTRAIGQVTD